jgi:tRNA threonylcarbamoyl adenosine modification protein YeaZ
MLILALDTTTPFGSAAVAEGGRVRAEARVHAADGHAAWLLPAVDRLVREAGATARDLEGIAVTVGPGSFTGLRVGLSTAQGLALATGRPCVGLTSLEAVAALAREEHPGRRVWALVDAWRDEVYAQAFGAEGQAEGEPRAVRPEVLLHEGGADGNAVYAGTGAERYRGIILAQRPDATLCAVEPYLAATLARLGAERLAAGRGGTPGTLLPVYLRDAGARGPRP